ncbi:unnamed protein product, partial [Mesorhabditis belari]|uniref:Serine/threonine-protein phosphatase n=1 Tax=Mesorhabditis belari TaxID=2138241 RepID=A0AAF3ECQ3_9BILA
MVNVPAFIDKLLSVNDLTQASLTRSINEKELDEVILECKQIVLRQPAFLVLEPPINLVGDIHGQYVDLLRIFNRCRFPNDANYLFLGDYVDRGRQQLETIALLMAYKILYPDTFFILRGNHESRSISKVYGFYEECKRRYNVRLWESFQDLFNSLPFAALVGGRIFCMHGGLSPSLNQWDQIDNVTRPVDPPNKSLHMDLLWADPEQGHAGWGVNTRGVSYIFGEDVVHDFCTKMDIDLIARGHQVVQDGFEFFADRKLVTIFSAPKYCGEFDNNAAVLIVDTKLECSFEILKATDTQIKIRSKRRKKSKKR